MNISNIKATPIWETYSFKDYALPIKKVLEEKGIKTWIERSRYPEALRARVLEEGNAVLRVNHFEDGTIREMTLCQYGGPLCCICYDKPEDWLRLIKMVESEEQYETAINPNIAAENPNFEQEA